MNWLLWSTFVARLAGAVAIANGAAPREIAYLNLITNAAAIAALTNDDLRELATRYEAEVAGAIVTTPDELEAIAVRIAERGARIQSA